LAAPGLHDEDSILWGQGLRVLRPPFVPVAPKERASYVPQTLAELREQRSGRPGQRVPPPRMKVRR
jgi:hypothetical protein